MAKHSAALLLFRMHESNGLEVLIAHMGGPFWAKKNARAWSIPKGEYESDEDPLEAAHREFEEEMGSPAPDGDPVNLGERDSPAEKSSLLMLSEATLTCRDSGGNCFPWNGRRGQGNSRNFQKLTAQTG